MNVAEVAKKKSWVADTTGSFWKLTGSSLWLKKIFCSRKLIPSWKKIGTKSPEEYSNTNTGNGIVCVRVSLQGTVVKLTSALFGDFFQIQEST